MPVGSWNLNTKQVDLTWGISELFLSLSDHVNNLLRLLRPDAVHGFSQGVIVGHEQVAHLAETLLVLSSAHRLIIPQNPLDDTGLAQEYVAGNRQMQKFIGNAFEVSFPLRIQIVAHATKVSHACNSSRAVLASHRQIPMVNPAHNGRKLNMAWCA